MRNRTLYGGLNDQPLKLTANIKAAPNVTFKNVRVSLMLEELHGMFHTMSY